MLYTIDEFKQLLAEKTSIKSIDAYAKGINSICNTNGRNLKQLVSEVAYFKYFYKYCSGLAKNTISDYRTYLNALRKVYKDKEKPAQFSSNSFTIEFDHHEYLSREEFLNYKERLDEFKHRYSEDLYSIDIEEIEEGSIVLSILLIAKVTSISYNAAKLLKDILKKKDVEATDVFEGASILLDFISIFTDVGFGKCIFDGLVVTSKLIKALLRKIRGDKE